MIAVRGSIRALLLGCWVLGTLVGCGGGGGAGPVSYVGEESSALIQASKGGDVGVGALKVAVPAEALEKDTRLTVEVDSKKDYPDRARIAIDVYALGPKGTTFSKDIELKFDLKGVKVGKNRRASVAELDEETNTWKALPGSKVVDGQAVATTKHFSFYTVLLEESAGAYEPVVCDADFVPCGGDLTGAWEFTKGCVTGFSQGTPMPVFSGDSCDAAFSSVSVDVSGSAHFGTEQDTNIDQIVVVTSSFSIPLACLAEVSQAGGTPFTCDTFGGVVEGRNCTQSSTSGDIPSTVEGTYATEGGTLTIESSDGYVLLGLSTLDPDIDYCVRGDTLTLRLRDTASGGEPQVYEATRASGT
jgi:hypothetical protein